MQTRRIHRPYDFRNKFQRAHMFLHAPPEKLMITCYLKSIKAVTPATAPISCVLRMSVY